MGSVWPGDQIERDPQRVEAGLAHPFEPFACCGGLGKAHRVLDDPDEEIVAFGPAASAACEDERGGCDDQSHAHGPAH